MFDTNIERATLPKRQKLFFGVGHVLNDLCSNCWFSYVLIYMTKVAGLSNSKAGLVLLIGQISDGLSTVVVGWCCDRTKFKFYGRRKLWHAIGTLCVLLSFPFVFNVCLACFFNDSELTKLIYYGCFVVIFQFGWAATQISHLALIPEITTKKSQTVELNAIRSGLTFVCGIFIFCVTWLLLGTSNGDKVDSSLSHQFMILTLVIIGVGVLFSLIFHCGTIEKRCIPKVKNDDEETLTEKHKSCKPVKTFKSWLKDTRLYTTGLMFMCTRITIYVFQAFFPLYLTDALHFDKEAIAYFPLIVLISGSFTSSLLKFITKRIGTKLTYVAGALLVIASSIWLYIVDHENRSTVYGAAWVTGSGLSIILVTSLSKTADIIGKDKDSSAFVYSAMGISYKIVTGVIIFVIQNMKPSSNDRLQCKGCEIFSKIVQACVPGFFVSLGMITVIFFFPSEFECRRKRYTKDNYIQTEPIEQRDEATQCDQYINEILDDGDQGVISLDSYDMKYLLADYNDTDIYNIKESRI